MKHWILFWTTVLGPLLTQGQGTVSLLENSPFLPPARAEEGNADEKPPPYLTLLQLRGITSLGGEYIFSIYNPSTKQSKWIRQGVQEEGLTIRSYNPIGNTVMIHSQFENLSHQVRLNEYAQPTAASVPKVAPTPPSATQPTTATTATSAETASQANRTVDTSRPSRRNLEILRERRQALADQLRQQSTPGSRSSNASNR
ncbi:MAG: hypothetical protein F7O42_05195 [Opitutae bacterium]|nr:hypothetical protein [Opitutae bacterium]